MTIAERFKDSKWKGWVDSINDPRVDENSLSVLGWELMGYGGTFILEFDYKAIRCMLLVRPNDHVNHVRDCLENSILCSLGEVIHDEEHEDQDRKRAVRNKAPGILEALWPHFIAELERRGAVCQRGVCTERAKEAFIGHVMVKTLDDGKSIVCRMHCERAAHKARPPFPNPLPELRKFYKAQMEDWVRHAKGLFEVHISGKQCFLKTIKGSGRLTLKRELMTLAKLPNHPNVEMLEGVLSVGDGYLEGILLESIRGTPLHRIKLPKAEDCEKWKKQL